MVHSMDFNQLKLLFPLVLQFSLDSGPLGELPESEARVKTRPNNALPKAPHPETKYLL